MKKETPEQRRARVGLEHQCADVGRTIAGACPSGTGFVLMMFDFGAEGSVAYVSNAQREDMVNLLREALEKLTAERGGP